MLSIRDSFAGKGRRARVLGVEEELRREIAAALAAERSANRRRRRLQFALRKPSYAVPGGEGEG